jgi:hypothetical protein
MRPRILMYGLLVVATAGPVGHASPSGTADAGFERLKTLVGEWRTDLASGPAQLSYELVAGGTTLVERETATNRPTMITLYHRDGDRLLLTHFCMVGNQPRMQARPFDAATGELAFDFLDATNLAGPGAGHMHSTTIRFVDADHIDTVWQFYDKGQPSMTERARYARVR